MSTTTTTTDGRSRSTRWHGPTIPARAAQRAGFGLRVYPEGGGYEVWFGPAEDLDAGNIINACVIGTGDSVDAALADARRELVAVLQAIEGRA